MNTEQAVEIWLAIPAFWLALSLYEIAAILTHRFHTISYLSAHNPWLAWVITGLAAGAAIAFIGWWLGYHLRNPQAIPW